MLAWFRVLDADEAALTVEYRKGGGIQSFLGHLTAEASQVPGEAGLTLIEVDRDVGAHILYSLFSVLVGTYAPDRWLFGCCRELPPEGIPTITEIPVTSFAARRDVSDVPREDHIVYLEVVSTSRWWTMPCKKVSGKAYGKNLTYRGLTFLPPDAATSLIHIEGKVVDFSKEMFPRLASRDPQY